MSKLPKLVVLLAKLRVYKCTVFNVFLQISGVLADLLSEYASLLAAQGNLETALSYLGSSQNEKVASLRDRLLTALGQKPLNIQEMRQQQANRRSSTRTSQSGYPGAAFNAGNAFHVSQSYEDITSKLRTL